MVELENGPAGRFTRPRQFGPGVGASFLSFFSFFYFIFYFLFFFNSPSKFVCEFNTQIKCTNKKYQHDAIFILIY